jgi:hypothetical protein
MEHGAPAARLMAMNDRVWMRHANPWSGYTRLATAPFLFLAIWSHVWIGWWALAPLAVLLLWIWLNPRVFPPPRDTDNWMSKGVFGERIWLNRREVPIPRRFERTADLLTSGAAVGVAIAAYGFTVADFWASLFGCTLAVVFKMWFVDRMVWLFEVMKAADPRYAGWQRPVPAAAARAADSGADTGAH